MKNFVFAITVFLLTMIPMKNSRYYTLNGTIVKINNYTEEITILDENGNLWTMIGLEDWMLDDNCKMIMYDSNTTDFHDDKIVSCVYTG